MYTPFSIMSFNLGMTCEDNEILLSSFDKTLNEYQQAYWKQQPVRDALEKRVTQYLTVYSFEKIIADDLSLQAEIQASNC